VSPARGHTLTPLCAAARDPTPGMVGAVRKAGRLLQAYQNFFQEMRASALVAGFERGFYGEVDRARHSEMLTRARDGRAVARKRSDELVRKALH
jgi:hypothetical protein